jgi:Nif-specific regulatory protein
MPILKLMVEGNCVEIFSLEKKHIVIGRKKDCDVRLFDRSISSVHAEIIQKDENKYQIKDKKSRNGVWVNGERIKTKSLQYNDEIILGKTHLLFNEGTSQDIEEPSFYQDKDQYLSPDSLFVRPHSEEPFSFQILHKDYEGLKESYQKLLQFYEVSKAINSTLDYHTFLEQVLDILWQLLKVERGFIAFLDESTGEYACQIARGFESVGGGGRNLPVSSFMIDKVREGGSILTVNAAEDDRFKKRESVREFHIKSVMCVPIFLRSRVFGIIYVDSRITTASFTKDDLEFLTAIGNQVAIAIENVNLHKQILEENKYLRSVISSQDKIVGESNAIKQLYSIIGKVSNHDSAVLITGETGTGKELVARAIHNNSQRESKPFICVTCSLISTTLIESELFGYERGAFTGAVESKKGRLEIANGGTIFLDEIGEVAPEVQVKLLRFLERREIERIGGNRTIKLDVRVLAATNKDLSEGIKDGSFREDLFYRLNSIQIHIPPLRNRVEDIPTLTDHFLDYFSMQMSRPKKKISAQAMDLMRIYEWPGNVRELKNTMERAMVLGGGDTILPQDLPEEIRKLADRLPVAFPPLSQIEREHIIQALKMAGGNKTQAAAILRIGRATLYEKVKQYNIR